jgi:hypothetical protein
MSCDVCRKAGPDIAGKTEFITGKKKFKRESLVYHNKSQKHEKCFNIVSAKAHKEILFTRQQKYVTSQINKDTNSYYITPICIYFFGNNKGNFIISPISFFSDCFSKD